MFHIVNRQSIHFLVPLDVSGDQKSQDDLMIEERFLDQERLLLNETSQGGK